MTAGVLGEKMAFMDWGWIAFANAGNENWEMGYIRKTSMLIG